MSRIRQVNIEPIVDLLTWAAPSKSKGLDDLLARLRPRLQLDYDDPRILFRADTGSNTITVGLQCTCRLQAHAYAYASLLYLQGTPGYAEISLEERVQRLAPADDLLNWAVSRDLQQRLARIEGAPRPLDEILAGGGVKLPSGPLSSLNDEQRAFARGFSAPPARSFCFMNSPIFTLVIVAAGEARLSSKRRTLTALRQTG